VALLVGQSGVQALGLLRIHAIYPDAAAEGAPGIPETK